VELNIDVTPEVQATLDKSKELEIEIERACHWAVRLFEHNHYQPMPAQLIKKLSKRAGIEKAVLWKVRERLLITFERTSKPEVKWFWAMPSPTERLLLESRGIRDTKTKKDRVADQVVEMLMDGPKPAQEIWDVLRKQGISMRTVYRAKKFFHIKSKQTADGWVWYLTD
jgi:hypothetical protein